MYTHYNRSQGKVLARNFATLNTLMYLLSEGYFKKAIDHSNAVAPKYRNPKKKTIYRKHSLFHKRSSI